MQKSKKRQMKKEPSLAMSILEALLDGFLLTRPEAMNHYAFTGRWPEWYYKQTIDRMEERDWIKTGPNMEIRVTKAGSSAFEKFKKRNQMVKDLKWDGKWRIVAFDIPEEERKSRTYLRAFLKRLGFLQVQRSVWIYPYDCRNELADICAELEIENYVSLFVGNYAGDESKLKKHFELV